MKGAVGDGRVDDILREIGCFSTTACARGMTGEALHKQWREEWHTQQHEFGFTLFTALGNRARRTPGPQHTLSGRVSHTFVLLGFVLDTCHLQTVNGEVCTGHVDGFITPYH